VSSLRQMPQGPHLYICGRAADEGAVYVPAFVFGFVLVCMRVPVRAGLCVCALSCLSPAS
jgi:hypothetical protein